MTIDEERARELNRAMWDERVSLHVVSDFYDVPGFKAGRCSLQPFEEAELGPVAGKDLVHLQCHFGLDTLSWARKGARVTGLDFSEQAVAEAAALAAEIGQPARFVCADVYRAPEALGCTFDVVYTGIGALLWLSDLHRWAQVVSALLRPGGCVYLVECHPLTDIFGEETLEVTENYFHDPAGKVYEGPGSYADATTQTLHNVSVEYKHPVSDVVSALLNEGLRIDLFHEFDHTAFARWPFLRKEGPTRWSMPADKPRLPLLYSLRASRPPQSSL